MLHGANLRYVDIRLFLGLGLGESEGLISLGIFRSKRLGDTEDDLEEIKIMHTIKNVKLKLI